MATAMQWPDVAEQERRRCRIANALEQCALRSVRWPVLAAMVGAMVAAMVLAALVASWVAESTVAATPFSFIDPTGQVHDCAPTGAARVFTCN